MPTKKIIQRYVDYWASVERETRLALNAHEQTLAQLEAEQALLTKRAHADSGSLTYAEVRRLKEELPWKLKSSKRDVRKLREDLGRAEERASHWQTLRSTPAAETA